MTKLRVRVPCRFDRLGEHGHFALIRPMNVPRLDPYRGPDATLWVKAGWREESGDQVREWGYQLPSGKTVSVYERRRGPA